MSTAYNAAVWSNFLSAELSASASLTGLIFVAVSINLSQIVVSKPLVARAAKAITTVTILVVAVFALVPAQSNRSLGAEIFLSGLLAWLIVTWMQHIAIAKNPFVNLCTRIFHNVFTQIASLPFLIAGLSLGAGRGGGLYWIVVGSLGSLIVALLDGWVLLIEIQR